MKLTKQQITKIKELKKEGKTAKEISSILKVSLSTIQYHYDPKVKKRQLNYQKEYQKKNPQIRGDEFREYQRKYSNKFYHSAENHERLKKYHRDYQKKRYDALKKSKGRKKINE
jgi:hypothetical protein